MIDNYYVADLLVNGCQREDLAVLTLYSGQVRLLRETLAKVTIYNTYNFFGSFNSFALFQIRVEVSSIDGFQGREAEVVVVSTVRADGRLGMF